MTLAALLKVRIMAIEVLVQGVQDSSLLRVPVSRVQRFSLDWGNLEEVGGHGADPVALHVAQNVDFQVAPSKGETKLDDGGKLIE